MEYFIAVCEELHFTKAAEKIGISQPNLSLQIKALEEEIGTPLFDRIGKRIAMTEAGSILLRHGQSLFQNLQNAFHEIDELLDHHGGSLAIGVLPSEMDYRLTPLFIDFHHRFPNVMYPKGYWGRELVENCCREYGFNLNMTIETTSNPSLFRFVRENIGVTVQTYPLFKSINDPS